MKYIRNADNRGHANFGWLDSHHSFSFGNFYDPKHMGVSVLRVINDDRVAPGAGFDTHSHRDMEIITYVRDGAITHKDHLGNEGRTEAGDVQVMSAGDGIQHAEHNREDEATRIFQIWIAPSKPGGMPQWDQARFPREDRSGSLIALASGQGHDGALPIRADAAVYGATLNPGDVITQPVAGGRYAYLVPAKGEVFVNGERVTAREGAALRDVSEIKVEVIGDTPAEILLADVPA